MSFKKQLRSRLRPLQALVHDAVDATTVLIAEGNDATGRTVVRAVSAAAPPLGGAAEGVETVRRVYTAGVLATVRQVNRGVQALSDAAVTYAEHQDDDEPVVALHGDRFLSVEGAADQLVGVLNGFVGDHLARSGNALDLGVRFRYEDRFVADPSSLDDVSGRIVLLVHGLSTTELSWSLDAERALGDAEAHFGELLRRSLGYTPLYLRYNTGRTIEENGDLLASELEALVNSWPVPVEEIVLLGHSMGGLVSRAATRAAVDGGHGWVEPLTHVICLGSPHRGAPLARFGHATADMLDAVDLPATKVLGRIIDGRSAGVKDLRHRDHEPLGPLLDDVTYLFVAGSLARSPEHALAAWLGDVLVPVESASGPAGANVVVRHVPRVAHHQLQTHQAVYEMVEEVLSRGS